MGTSHQITNSKEPWQGGAGQETHVHPLSEVPQLLLDSMRVLGLLSRSLMSDSLQPHGLPGSSVYGVSQARILEWVALSFSRRSSRSRDRTHVSCIAGAFLTLSHWRRPK